MKRRGILNDALSYELARLGHTDLVVVADAGLPRPAGVRVVDLALTFGVPAFAQVVDALAEEIVVEHATLAAETTEQNPAAQELIVARFGEPDRISHEALKTLSGRAKLFIRTGAATPYANVVLRCGVPF
ncbi:MAG: D-ribose pyranase [Georgenia sp.]